MDTGTPSREGYFERIDEHRYAPTAHTGGAWDPNEQHFSPLGGLVVHAIDRHRARHADTAMELGRIGFDILGRLPMSECEVRVETIRPGRTIELVEATVYIADRAAVRARAWFMTGGDTASVAGGAPEPLTPPDGLDPRPIGSAWPGGYIASLEVRPLAEPLPGRASAWIRSGLDVVAGETAGPAASFVAHVDTANGIAVRRPPSAWMFPNLDLTVHLYRRPEGGWTGLDTTVVFGDTGQGLTSSVLHDVTGPVGRAHQLLTVRPLTADGEPPGR
ncbi:thioesterase family protein [Nocardiopsis sp. CT-R113]|uniref:Thioesterase family protein n=1 Tax=Nocardiopsis codii TaxID=3065942 RepID=A0ABU7KFG9_9ACTN|nr:thioesterase family protein [Nocardiopsis sp. CT-R113]MEE2040968.1 thioesterase family protein [Nocardiopsis sp. CT-R113]